MVTREERAVIASVARRVPGVSALAVARVASESDVRAARAIQHALGRWDRHEAARVCGRAAEALAATHYAIADFAPTDQEGLIAAADRARMRPIPKHLEEAVRLTATMALLTVHDAWPRIGVDLPRLSVIVASLWCRVLDGTNNGS